MAVFSSVCVRNRERKKKVKVQTGAEVRDEYSDHELIFYVLWYYTYNVEITIVIFFFFF